VERPEKIVVEGSVAAPSMTITTTMLRTYATLMKVIQDDDGGEHRYGFRDDDDEARRIRPV
jgi:hypothetical protein